VSLRRLVTLARYRPGFSLISQLPTRFTRQSPTGADGRRGEPSRLVSKHQDTPVEFSSNVPISPMEQSS
jgi:hypothetical protein